MAKTEQPFSRRGRKVTLPCVRIGDRLVIVVGRILRSAVIHDEVWLNGDHLEDPIEAIAAIKKARIGADLFTFSEKIPHTEPRYPFHIEWDNFAAVPIHNYEQWWESLSQATRKNVRRASNKGVTVKTVPLDRALIEGVVSIYNETPIRQGRSFPKYGQGFDRVKADLSKNERTERVYWCLCS